jgi:hypothetical protein
MSNGKQRYQIRIEGHITLDWSASFDEVTVRHSRGETILMVIVPDQTALHGVLMKIRDLGLSLLEVKRIGIGAQSE